MTYTTDSSFLSGPIGSASLWADAIRPHNPEQADAIAAAYFDNGAAIGINADLALAQACHESGWFTSDHWRTQFNPAGLGIVANDTVGVGFGSIENGVRAHYEHLACYTMADDPGVMATWGMLDPRHTFHDNRPRVADLERFQVDGAGVRVSERMWAVPEGWPNTDADPQDYCRSIVGIANSIVGETSPATGGTMEPTQAEIGFPVEVDYASLIGPDRAVADVQWFIVHDTEGGEVGSEGVLKGRAASVHALIDVDGALEYMVPIEKTAWTAGNDAVSKLAIQVELVGFAANGSYPEAQYQSLAAFFRWCQSQGMTVPATYIGRKDANGGPLPDAPGIIGHQDVPNPDVPGAWGGVAGHTDPGSAFDWQHLIDTIAGHPADPNVSPTYRKFAATGHGIDGGFETYWGANGGLAIFGYPLSEEMQEGGRTTQYFQRAVFRLFPEFTGTPYEVQLDLLGTAAAKAAGLTGAGIN